MNYQGTSNYDANNRYNASTQLCTKGIKTEDPNLIPEINKKEIEKELQIEQQSQNEYYCRNQQSNYQDFADDLYSAQEDDQPNNYYYINIYQLIFKEEKYKQYLECFECFLKNDLLDEQLDKDVFNFAIIIKLNFEKMPVIQNHKKRDYIKFWIIEKKKKIYNYINLFNKNDPKRKEQTPLQAKEILDNIEKEITVFKWINKKQQFNINQSYKYILLYIFMIFIFIKQETLILLILIQEEYENSEMNVIGQHNTKEIETEDPIAIFEIDKTKIQTEKDKVQYYLQKKSKENKVSLPNSKEFNNDQDFCRRDLFSNEEENQPNNQNYITNCQLILKDQKYKQYLDCFVKIFQNLIDQKIILQSGEDYLNFAIVVKLNFEKMPVIQNHNEKDRIRIVLNLFDQLNDRILDNRKKKEELEFNQLVQLNNPIRKEYTPLQSKEILDKIEEEEELEFNQFVQQKDPRRTEQNYLQSKIIDKIEEEITESK